MVTLTTSCLLDFSSCGIHAKYILHLFSVIFFQSFTYSFPVLQVMLLVWGIFLYTPWQLDHSGFIPCRAWGMEAAVVVVVNMNFLNILLMQELGRRLCSGVCFCLRSLRKGTVVLESLPMSIPTIE